MSSRVSSPQPPPQPGKQEVLPLAINRLGNFARTAWGKLLIDSLTERAVAGEKKYGTRLQSFNGRDAMVDAFQEAQDAVMYLNQRLMESNNVEAVRVIELLHLAEDLACGIASYIESKERVSGQSREEDPAGT